MNEHYQKIAKILRISPGDLLDLDQKMSLITGQKDVIESISKENDVLVKKSLAELGLHDDASADEIYNALITKLIHVDKHLFELLDKPDLANLSNVCGKICETAFKVFTPPKGLFIKQAKAIELLDKFKPTELLDHFKCATVAELVEKEGFAPVVSSLRFVQSQEWMHKFFDEAYTDIKPTDFEERDVEMLVLEHKWLEVAEKFLEKKYHNVSHLKEFGVIFITPIVIDSPGETSRMFTLLLHYLHEVPFYSGLFRRYMSDPDFSVKFKSLLRGDVPSGPVMENGKVTWRIVQRYLAKDNENDPRLFQPHVNPEAEHWYRAEGDFSRLSRMMKRDDGELSLNCWTGLDFVGGEFKDNSGQDHIVSFNFIDLAMSLVKKGHIKYLYHHQEALWNKIFSEYMGREAMNRLVEENIISGFIEL